MPVHKPTPPEQKLSSLADSPISLGWMADSIAYQLRIAQELAFQRYKEPFQDVALHPGHFTALAVIATNPGCSQTALGEAIGRDKSTLTPLLSSLESDGLLVRQRRPDNQRTYSLSLTPRGAALLQSLERIGDAHERTISAQFSPEEKAALLRYLQRIIDLFK